MKIFFPKKICIRLHKLIKQFVNVYISFIRIFLLFFTHLIEKNLFKSIAFILVELHNKNEIGL